MHVLKNTSSYVGCVAVPHHMFDDLRIIFRTKPNKSPFLAEKSGVNTRANNMSRRASLEVVHKSQHNQSRNE